VEAEVREVLKAADLFQAEGLLKHCLEAFGGGLTVGTAAEALVWAHLSGPEEARQMATEYFVGKVRQIQVRPFLVLVRCALLRIQVSIFTLFVGHLKQLLFISFTSMCAECRQV
jgi:hypothetical protein